MSGGSETGLITSREAFGVVGGVGLQQNIRMPFSPSAVYKPIPATAAPASADGSPAAAAAMVSPVTETGTDPMKRKRGRPRKYGPDGTMALGLSPAPSSVAVGGFSSQPGGVDPSSGGGGGVGSASSPTSVKKARGRPPGSSSKKHHLDAMGSAGFGFTPHVITVKAGEDVLSKIMSFSQHGPRAVCVLSANGAISNVTLRQPATSGGTVTYEGRFEILSLSGSFLLSESGGQRSRTGGLSVSLSGTDGRVLGGGVAGLLTAAAPVQVVVGSFIAEGRKESKSGNRGENLSGTQNLGPSSPPSRGTVSESSGGPASPINQSNNNNNNNPQAQGMSAISWK